MPNENVSWREEMTINIDGGMASQHEISVETLAESLLGLRQLVERTNTTLHGKNCHVSIKIKGGFVQGSFEYQAAFDFFGASLPLIPQTVEVVKQVIDFKRFLGGKAPAKIEPQQGGQSSVVENNSGNVNVYQNNAIIIAGTSAATKAMKKFFAPFDNGANKVEISGGGTDVDALPIIVTEDEKATFLTPPSDFHDVQDKTCTLEVLTAQMDGKPENWRFFDVEDSTIFSAGVADHGFLVAVNHGQYGFLRGKHATATVRTIRQKVDGRMSTKRTVISITPLTDEQEQSLFMVEE